MSLCHYFGNKATSHRYILWLFIESFCLLASSPFSQELFSAILEGPDVLPPLVEAKAEVRETAGACDLG